MFKLLSTSIMLGLMTISAAFGQSSQAMQAEIPFAFSVQDRAMPAGTYRLTYDELGRFVSVQGLSSQTKSAFAGVATTSAYKPSNGPGRLIFECQGKACALARIWQVTLGESRSLEVRHPRSQRTVSFSTRVVAVRSSGR